MKKNKITVFLLTIFCCLSFTFPVFAASEYNEYIFLNAIIEVAVMFCKYGGVILGVITIWQLLTAINDNNSLKQSTSKKLFITSLTMLILAISLSEIADLFIKVTNSIFSEFA